MPRHTIPLGRIFGIPVDVDYSWFLVFVLLTWILAVGFYPMEFKHWTTAQYWSMGAVTAILLFVSVLLHELGHSVVALHYRIPVSKITLFIFGGVSQITAEPPSAGVEFQVAVAGPLVSFALAAIFYALRLAFAGAPPIAALCKYLALINGGLGVFNLIPGFPLDGGRVFRAAIWGASKNFRRATLIAANAGRFFGFALIAIGVWQILRGAMIDGIWTAFIGWFLESAAVGQVQHQVLQSLLFGHKVREAMGHDYLLVPPSLTLQDLVDQHILGRGQRCFVVNDGERLSGLLTLHTIKEVPRSAWATTTAAQAMIPAERVRSVPPDEELAKALEEMGREGVNQMPVMAGDTLAGMLSRHDIVNYLRTLQQLSH